jgi:hypothetical protein
MFANRGDDDREPNRVGLFTTLIWRGLRCLAFFLLYSLATNERSQPVRTAAGSRPVLDHGYRGVVGVELRGFEDSGAGARQTPGTYSHRGRRHWGT